MTAIHHFELLKFYIFVASYVVTANVDCAKFRQNWLHGCGDIMFNGV